MVNNFSPLRPNPKEDALSGTDRVKPHNRSLGDDRFRKSMDERKGPHKDPDDLAYSSERANERTPSLFDLSKSNRAKSQPSSANKSSTFNDSNSPDLPLPQTSSFASSSSSVESVDSTHTGSAGSSAINNDVSRSPGSHTQSYRDPGSSTQTNDSSPRSPSSNTQSYRDPGSSTQANDSSPRSPGSHTQSYKDPGSSTQTNDSSSRSPSSHTQSYKDPGSSTSTNDSSPRSPGSHTQSYRDPGSPTSTNDSSSRSPGSHTQSYRDPGSSTQTNDSSPRSPGSHTQSYRDPGSSTQTNDSSPRSPGSHTQSYRDPGSSTQTNDSSSRSGSTTNQSQRYANTEHSSKSTRSQDEYSSSTSYRSSNYTPSQTEEPSPSQSEEDSIDSSDALGLSDNQPSSSKMSKNIKGMERNQFGNSAENFPHTTDPLSSNLTRGTGKALETNSLGKEGSIAGKSAQLNTGLDSMIGENQAVGMKGRHPLRQPSTEEGTEMISSTSEGFLNPYEKEINKKETSSISDVAADPRAITSEAIAPPNPLQAEVTIEKQPPAIDSNTIRDLATQIIDRIQVMTKGNETQTMITLRHPPVLEGATITLTSSDHAKQEFNISFANLSPEAKLLLDNKLREDPLSAALERRGITVHILTTSTQPEQALIHTYSDKHERQEQGQQRQEQGQQKQEQGQQRQRQHKQPFQFSRDEDEL